MKTKIKTIGLMGGASRTTPEQENAGFFVGRAIAKNGCVLLTGATTGIPFFATKGAKELKGHVVGISPEASKENHIKKGLPTENIDTLIYTGLGFIGRNMINVRSSDALIFVAGNIGTLNEFTIAFEAKKPVGILTGIGGISDKLKGIISELNKGDRKRDRKIIYDDKPTKLVERLIGETNE